MGASHFEKAVQGRFSPSIDFLLRVESPKATLTTYGQLCPSGSLHTPSSGARRATKVSAVAGSRANCLCAPRCRGLPRIQKSHTGEDWFCGAWVARNGGPFSRSRQAACPQIFARRRGPGTRAPQAFVLIAGLRARKAAAVLWARCTGIFPCARK